MMLVVLCWGPVQFDVLEKHRLVAITVQPIPESLTFESISAQSTGRLHMSRGTSIKNLRSLIFGDMNPTAHNSDTANPHLTEIPLVSAVAEWHQS
jgi:hypothetical protein